MKDRRKKPNFQQVEVSTLLESMPEGVFIFDQNGDVTEVNQMARSLFESPGKKKDDLLGMNVSQLVQQYKVQYEGKLVDSTKLAVSRALAGEVVRHEPRTIKRLATGAPTEVLLSASPMRNKDDEIMGALVLIQDVSEIYALQRKLADTERHLAIGQMAADIGHDLNNVLSSIAQAAAVLEMHGDAKKKERKLYLDMIQNGARRGAEIIQRLREYIRGGKGERDEVDVCATLREALEFAKPRLPKTGDIRVETGFEHVEWVLGNAADLRRSFANLVLNAIDAMPHGGVLRVGCYDQGERVLTYVEDTGTGITPEDQEKIFAPYFTTKAKGTGLGLAGARRILQAHGGNISFQSEVNRGTKFVVELPALRNGKKAA